MFSDLDKAEVFFAGALCGVLLVGLVYGLALLTAIILERSSRRK